MTTPGGHPDYQSYSTWRAPFSWTGSFNVASGVNFFEQLNVTNWASIDLYVKLQAGVGVTVFCSFFNDAAATQFMGNYIWTLSGAGEVLQAMVPVLGNYCQIFINTGQAGNQNLLISVSVSNIPVSRCSYPLTGNVVNGTGVNVNAGVTLTAELPQVVDGDGQVSFNPLNGGTLVQVNVFELDESGAAVSICQGVLNPGGPAILDFIAGTRPVQLAMKNTDVAAHQYSYRATVVPR